MEHNDVSNILLTLLIRYLAGIDIIIDYYRI